MTAMSVTFAPRARIFVNASWPGRVEERDRLAVLLHAPGPDHLGDAAGFGGDHVRLDAVRLADRVQQRRLAVVDVTHDRDNRCPRLQLGLVPGRLFVLAEQDVLDVLLLLDVEFDALFLRDQLRDFDFDRAVDREQGVRQFLQLEQEPSRLHTDRFGQRSDGDRQADRNFALAFDRARQPLTTLLLQKRGSRPATRAERRLFGQVHLAALDHNVFRFDLLTLLRSPRAFDSPAILFAALAGRYAFLGLVLLVLGLVFAGRSRLVIPRLDRVANRSTLAKLLNLLASEPPSASTRRGRSARTAGGARAAGCARTGHPRSSLRWQPAVTVTGCSGRWCATGGALPAWTRRTGARPCCG